MCNRTIRIAVQEKPMNRFGLIQLACPHLKAYGLHTHSILSACEVAYSVYRNKNRKRIPYIRKASLKLDNQSYQLYQLNQLNHLLLRIPTTPRHFVFLTLEGSDYHSSFIDDPSLKSGSVTVTERAVTVAFSKEVHMVEPVGYIGVDINESNVTASATDGSEHKFDELGEVVEIKKRYREIRARIAKKTRGDRRIGKELLAKYGRRERDRTMQRVNGVTQAIVNYKVN